MKCHTNLYKEVYFNTYEEAEDVLDKMYGIANTLGNVTMADLMKLTDRHAVFADTKFYWTRSMLDNAVIDEVQVDRAHVSAVLRMPDPIHECEKPKVRYCSYDKPTNDKKDLCMSPIKPAPIYITINRDVYEDVDDVLKSLFKQMACLPGREFHITIE